MKQAATPYLYSYPTSSRLVSAGVTLWLLITALTTSAQIPKGDVNIQSPTVAALQSNFSPGVAPFTGAPTVSLPLYTLQEGAVNIPLTLRYSSQGFRPDEAPGWVGMGWSLDVGGTISRSVNDLPDELTVDSPPLSNQFWTGSYPNSQRCSNSESPYHKAGVYWMEEWPDLRKNAWDAALSNSSLKGEQYLAEMNDVVDTGYGSHPTQGTYHWSLPLPGMANVMDTEPDEFRFSFMGYSGSFYFNPKTSATDCSAGISADQSCNPGPAANENYCQWVVRCDRSLRVELIEGPVVRGRTDVLAPVPFSMEGIYTDYTARSYQTADLNNPKTFRGFLITTDDGTRFTFGFTPASIEYSKSIWDGGDYWTATAWHLDKIEYPNGQRVELSYQTDNQWGIGYYVNRFSYFGRDNLELRLGGIPVGCRSGSFGIRPWDNVTGSVIRQSFLSKISVVGSGTSIEFASGASASLPALSNEFLNAGRQRACGGQQPPGCTAWYPPTYNPMVSATPLLGTITVKTAAVPPSALPTATGAATPVLHSTVKRFEFAYSDSVGARQRLTRVAETTADGTGRLPGFLFSYWPVPEPLATNNPQLPHGTGEIDHWGFFSDKGFTPDCTIPNSYSNSTYLPIWSGGAIGPLRQTMTPSTPNLEIAKIGMLKTLRTPTDEVTGFEYERHTYGHFYDRLGGWAGEYTSALPGARVPSTTYVAPDTANAWYIPGEGWVAGGVRLKQITRRSAAGAGSAPQTISYSYALLNHPNGVPTTRRSSGILIGDVVYNFPRYQCKLPCALGATGNYLGDNVEVQVNAIHSMLPTLNGSGAHVGYSFITETYDDGARKVAGYSNFPGPGLTDAAYYVDQGLYTGLSGVTPYTPAFTRDDVRGKLMEEEWFAAPVNAGVAPRLIRRRTLRYSYAPVPWAGYPWTDTSAVGIRAVRVVTQAFNSTYNCGTQQLDGSGERRLLEATSYVIPVRLVALTSETTEDFELDNSQRASRRVTKLSRHMLDSLETVSTNDQAQTLTTRYSYPPDFFGTLVPTWMGWMQCRRQWRYPLEIVKLRAGKVIEATAYAYDSTLTSAIIQRNIGSPLINSIGAPLTNYTPYQPLGVTFPSPDWRQTARVDFRPGWVSSPVPRVPTATIDGTSRYTSTKWGYRQTLPVVAIRNAHANQISFENFEESFEPLPFRQGATTWPPRPRSRETGWEWVASTADSIRNPVLSPLGHTGRFSLRPPALTENNLSRQPRASRPPEKQGTAARPNIEACVVANPDSLSRSASADSLLRYKMIRNWWKSSSFWCLEGSIGINPTSSLEYELSFWARRDTGANAGDSAYVGAWVDICNRWPELIRVPSNAWRHYSIRYRIYSDRYGSQKAEGWRVWLGGTNVLLDDIRLAPRDARLTTYTHRPHVGVTSSIDENNHTTYYEYDEFGRLRATYDDDGNLLQAHQYQLSRP